MAKTKTTVGYMACYCCGKELPVKESETGNLDVSCKDCDFSAYAKPGTEANAIVRAEMRMKTQPKQAPAPENKAPPATKAVAAPTPAPAPRRASSIFDLGGSAT